MPQDPTIYADAIGYLRRQAALSNQNSREAALSDKCADYLREVIADNARLRAVLADIEFVENIDGCMCEVRCPSCHSQAFGPDGRTYTDHQREHAPACKLMAALYPERVP